MTKGSKLIRYFLFAICFFLMASWVSQVIVGLSGPPSLGSLARAIISIAVFFVLLAIVWFADLQGFSALLRPNVSPKQVGTLSIVALVVAYGLTQWGILGVLYVPIGTAVVLGLGVAFFFTITRDDASGLVVFLITLPFLIYLELSVARRLILNYRGMQWVLTPSIIALWMLAGALVVRMIARHKSMQLHLPLDKYVLTFGGILFLSVLNSEDIGLSLVMFYQTLTCGLLFYFLVTRFVRSVDGVIAVLGALTFRNLFVLLFWIYHYGQSVGFREMDLLAIGEAGVFVTGKWTGNMLMGAAGLLGLGSIPILISLSLLIRTRRWPLIIAIAAAIFAFTGMLLSKERTYVLALAITLPFMFMYRSNKRYLLLLMIGLGLVLYLYLSTGERFEPLARLGELSSPLTMISKQSMRITAWKAALGMMRDHPVLGIGPGMWSAYLPRYADQIYWWRIEGKLQMVYTSDAHNLLLEYGAGSGIGAALILMALIAEVVRRAIGLLRSSNSYVIYTLTVGILWVLTAYLIGALAGGSFYHDPWFAGGTMFWIPVGLLVVLDKIAGQPNKKGIVAG